MELKTWEDALIFTREKGYGAGGECGFCKVDIYKHRKAACKSCPVNVRKASCTEFWCHRIGIDKTRRRNIGEYVLAQVTDFTSENIRNAIIESDLLTPAELKVFNGEGE